MTDTPLTDTPPVYTAHDVPDLLGTLPTLLGFHPDESLVGVATRGPRRRFGFRLRVDIPPPELVDDLAAYVVDHLARQGAEGAILFAVTRHQDVAEALLDSLERQLGDIEPIALIRADGSRYWTPDPDCPTEGVPYETSDHHPAVVQAIAAGQEILPSRAALVDRYRAVSGPRRRWLLHAADTVLAQTAPIISRTPPDEIAEVGMAIVGPILDRALAEEHLTDEDLMQVAVWVSGIAVRDEVWGRITAETCEDMLRVLALVSRSVVPPFEPAVLSLAGFAAWLCGDGAQALVCLERALDADPEYSMALLLLEMLQAAVPPTAWTAMQEAKAEARAE
jgi:hypothetical protein